MPRLCYLTACASLIGLIFFCLLWELYMAPLTPGGSALVFKVLPLLAPLMGILRGRRYTYRWSTLLILVYFAEGLVRASSDSGPSRYLAWGEIAFCLVFFTSAVCCIRQRQGAGSSQGGADLSR